MDLIDYQEEFYLNIYFLLYVIIGKAVDSFCFRSRQLAKVKV